jgi:hypothetical protein
MSRRARHVGQVRGSEKIPGLWLDTSLLSARNLSNPLPMRTPGRRSCPERVSLFVMLPSVSMGGTYQIDIGSYHYIVDLNSYLAFY